jgi:outer membrane protein assembly factor BamA
LHDPVHLERLVAVTKRWLRSHGYLRAEIASRLHTTCEGVIVQLEVTLGRRFTLTSIVIHGSELPWTFERELGTINTVGASYDEAGFAYDLDELVRWHHRRGWIDAEAIPPTRRIDDATGHVSVQSAITPGKRYKLEVLVEGGTPEQRKAIDAVFAPLRGQWYDVIKIEEAYDAVAQYAGDELKYQTVSGVEHGVYQIRVLLGGAP